MTFCYLLTNLTPSNAAPLKNALDWASRPQNVWADKAAAIISASGGSVFLKAFEPPAKFDKNSDLIDAQTRENLKQVLLSLQAFTLRLQGR
ncbi:hypothetical protein Prudu_005427 [Prunus dulcis]|uniref:NAD(P)H dehydrogenase (quinone) n=1 Tax=Prunus dulcis TaxID=3755 RepID=A0A4Y1QXL1_PRUDU|nr:hypothetical protein Prudu_005427 [Prunus dulcis]